MVCGVFVSLIFQTTKWDSNKHSRLTCPLIAAHPRVDDVFYVGQSLKFKPWVLSWISQPTKPEIFSRYQPFFFFKKVGGFIARAHKWA